MTSAEVVFFGGGSCSFFWSVVFFSKGGDFSK